MICWVNREEKRAIQEANTQCLPIYFSESRHDFESRLDNESFPVISVEKGKLRVSIELVRRFPNIKFYPLDHTDQSGIDYRESKFLDEPNVGWRADDTTLRFLASEIITLFEKQE
jgi:hypothetical protein